MDIDEAINYILVRELTFVAISCGIKPTCPSLSIMLLMSNIYIPCDQFLLHHAVDFNYVRVYCSLETCIGFDLEQKPQQQIL